MKKQMLCILGITILFYACSQHPLKTGRDWTTWRGPFGNGSTDESNWNPEALQDSVKIRWRAEAGDGHGAVCVKGNRAFVFGNQVSINGSDSLYHDVLTCLEAQTGEEIWKFTYPNPPGDGYPGPMSTPALDEECIYTTSRTGIIHCLNSETGQKKWSVSLNALGFKTNEFYCCSPIIHKNMLLLRIGKIALALDKRSGKTIWSILQPADTSASQGQDKFSSPMVFKLAGKTVTGLLTRDSLKVLDIDNGSMLWGMPCEEGIIEPIAIGDKLLVSLGKKRIETFDISSNLPESIWSIEKDWVSFQGIAIHKNRLFYFTGRDFLCRDLDNGDVIWIKDKYKQDWGNFGSMMIAGDKLIVITGKGRLNIAEAFSESYQEISSAQIFNISEDQFKDMKNCCWTQPVLSHGCLYIRTITGEVACVDLR